MWISGVKDNTVYIVKTADGYFQLEEFINYIKSKYESVHLWAVLPDNTNCYFAEFYKDTSGVKELVFEDVLKEIEKM